MMAQPLSPTENAAYVVALEELTLELKRAITAVTTGALSEFEHSLIRQQISCAHLAVLRKQSFATKVESVSPTSVLTDPMLAERIAIAVSALNAVIRHYSMLLKHFSETARVFAGVFRTYGGSAGIGFCLQKTQGVWSCEL